tara:strand:+ start:1736 stop:1957 length:222 start_codon:yes stop_codon:yes gene_type:complete
MSIDLKTLQDEKIRLRKDFDELSTKIITFDKEIVSMKNNLNALHGAIQQTDKLIKLVDVDGNEKQLLNEKENG